MTGLADDPGVVRVVLADDPNADVVSIDDFGAAEGGFGR